MKYDNQIYKNTASKTTGMLAGVLVGGLAGALTMLLLAPRSGKDTRMQMKEKGIELRDRTTELVEETVAQVRTKANQLAVDLKDRGQDIAVTQLDHVSEAAQAGKKAIQSS